MKFLSTIADFRQAEITQVLGTNHEREEFPPEMFLADEQREQWVQEWDILLHEFGHYPSEPPIEYTMIRAEKIA